MQNITDNTQDTAQDTSRSAVVSYLLEQLQEKLSEELDQVDASLALLPLGTKTDLVKQIEDDLEDPFQSLFDASFEFNQRVLQILASICKGFIQENRSRVHSAYLIPSNDLVLNYFIILHEDSEENRDFFYSFLNKLDASSLSQLYKAVFNFIELEDIDALPSKLITLKLDE